MSYQITIIDDHPIVANGIMSLLQQEDGVACNCFTSPDNLREQLMENSADLYILDLSMPDINGFHLIEFIQQSSPKSKIMVYTMHEEPWIIEQLSDKHIQGAVTKSAPLSELTEAVRTIRNGQKFFSSVFSMLQHDYHSGEDNKNRTPVLSKREKEVLHYITAGKNTAEIAEALYLSANTIHTYRKRLMSKLNAKNAAELVYKGKDFF